MTELENLMFLSLGTLLNTYFSPWSLPNLSEAQTFSPANANMVLNFLKSERHILVWKAFFTFNLDPCLWLSWKWHAFTVNMVSRVSSTNYAVNK